MEIFTDLFTSICWKDLFDITVQMQYCLYVPTWMVDLESREKVKRESRFYAHQRHLEQVIFHLMHGKSQHRTRNFSSPLNRRPTTQM
jgi:hypothetical protein